MKSPHGAASFREVQVLHLKWTESLAETAAVSMRVTVKRPVDAPEQTRRRPAETEKDWAGRNGRKPACILGNEEDSSWDDGLWSGRSQRQDS